MSAAAAPSKAATSSPEWDQDTPSADSNESRDRQLVDELATLLKERDEIMACSEQEFPTEFADLVDTVKKRLQSAADLRDYQLASLHAQVEVERQQAWNEFEHGKLALRNDMLSMAVERRRRIDALRATAVAKKKKRRHAVNERVAKRARSAGNRAFLQSLEHQGLVRLALSPDEVNTDLALILNGIDSARANGPPRPPVSRPTDTGARSVEKIHSSRGILHYHDITYEKGDRASVFTHARPGVGKIGLPYSGTILSVNAKEIQIKTDDGTSHRVSVGHLRNGRYILKPANATKAAAS